MELFRETRKPVNLKQKAGVLSRIFFWWTFLVIRNGHRKLYEIEDMPSPLPQDRSEKLGNKLEKAWLKELESSKICRRKASLLKTIVRVFWKEFIRIALLHSFNEFFISISRQIFLGYFLIYLKETKTDATLIYRLKIIGITLVLSYGLNNLLTNHFLARSYHLGCKIKIALSSLMFRKCLRLGNNVDGDASTGRILNLMSNDVAKFDDIIMYCNYAYSGLISTLIISAILCGKVNLFATTVCLVCVLLPTPAQIFISKTMASFRAKIANASDERIRTMDEIICGIQIIKMYAWEKPYEKLLMYKRKVEMKLIRKALYLRGMRIAINVVVSKFSLYAIVVVYSLSGGKVVPEMVFVVLGYCTIIAKVMSGMFFRSFGECSECLVSTKRIQNFLELNEFKTPLTNTSNEVKNAIEFRNVTCSWHLDSNRDTLKNITFNIEANKFATLIGQVGSGKSSLLSAILGELPMKGGNLKLNGSVSYYSQTPWIFAGTIRRNIIFYEEYDPEKYKKVVEACALERDFMFLPDADLTLIGERGITLSGGQKARVALARTLYKTADIYLLDDPLSAVDTRVSKQIFQRCILNLLKDKTCILVSHQLQFLLHSDQVILLQEGEVKYEGTFDQLLESDPTYRDIFKKSQDVDSERFKSRPNDENDDANHRKRYEVWKDTVTADRTRASASQRTNATGDELEKEENEITDPYALLRFLKRGAGTGGLILISCLFVSTQILISSCDVWLAYWTSAETNALNEGDTSNGNKKWHYFAFEMSANKYFIVGYSTILLGVVIAVCLRNYTFAYYGQKCSKKIHKDAFHSVVRTNSSFFHNNPTGRILNRFSKDMGAVDEILIPFLLEATASFMQVLAAFVVSASISVAYIVPAVIIFTLLIVVRNYYLHVSVNLKRLESIAKSPVFVHVHSTLQGLPIIRACSVTEKLVCEFDRQQDVYSSAWYLYNMTAFGYAYCLEVMCFIYLAVIVIGSFFLNLSGSQIGLALAQLTLLLNFVQWAMKLSAEVSNQVTSVDRLLRYTDLESEKQPIEDSVPKDWPSKGRIIFNDVSFRYAISSQPAIRNISFIVEPEQNIGIVGRTGAGKTSLLAVLFRLGYVDGSIIIDDVDTSFVRLEKLRSKISVIPQDPVLFSGTLRTNLDPFKEYNDDTLWKAIEDAQLKKVVAETDKMGLDTKITEGGKNFSVGQRQLVCLARAIIRNNKILILDEATASVDQQTDSIIRKTIRDKLKSRTVLTIAHRLNTVVDCDKILVMDGGSVVEYGHPYLLLRNRDGFFYKLVSETGDFVAAALTGIAKENYLFSEQQKNTNVNPS